MRYFLVFVLVSNSYAFKVIVDPAHGGHDNGIKTEASIEKDIVLKCANSMKNIIASKNINVLLTREVDINLSQEERAGYSNKMGGDLFISLHTNFSFSPKKYGTEIYLFEEAPPEEFPLLIRWDRVPLKHIKISIRITQKIVERFRNFFADVKVKKAKVYPLVGVDMPAMVLELDYLSHTPFPSWNLLMIKCESFAKSIIDVINKRIIITR